MTHESTGSRRHDLDWLRVIAFGLLIFYHIGMYYVTWGWHVKSPHAGSFLEAPMMLLNPWRLSLLFLISGVAFKFVLDKMDVATITGKRIIRLLIPLVFGMAVIVAPQSYYELLAKGEVSAGYLGFWALYLDGSEDYSVHIPTWNHLWYVVYLLVYSLFVLPFVTTIQKLSDALDGVFFEQVFAGLRLFILPALLFVFYRFTTGMYFPEEHNLTWDWDAHARYFSYFLIGMLVAKNGAFWSILAEHWRQGAIFTIVLGTILLPLWINWEWVSTNDWIMQPARALRPIYAWAMILTLLGAAQEYLNKPSARLTYLTDAVFPYYILHQTLIVVIGVNASGLGLSAIGEFLIVLAGTVAGCVLLHEYIIRRIFFLRPLFGLSLKPRSVAGAKAGYPAE